MEDALTSRLATEGTEIHYEEWDSGTKIWRLNGRFYRTNGPAIEHSDGSKYWYLNGILHREDGPAFEYADGYKEWYLNGIQYSEQEYYQELVRRGSKTPEEVFLIML